MVELGVRCGALYGCVLLLVTCHTAMCNGFGQLVFSCPMPVVLDAGDHGYRQVRP